MSLMTADDFVIVTTRHGHRKLHYAERDRPRYRDLRVTLCGHPEHPTPEETLRELAAVQPMCVVCAAGRTRRMTGRPDLIGDQT